MLVTSSPSHLHVNHHVNCYGNLPCGHESRIPLCTIEEEESGCGFDIGQSKKWARHGISIVEHIYGWLDNDGDV